MVRPLTKIKRDGVTRYAHSPEIEASIAEALEQDLETMKRRAQERDSKQPGYLPSECLVHLIREAQRRGDDRGRDTLLLHLLARCHRNLRAKVPDGQIATAPQLREDILGDFAELFAIDGSAGNEELDFFEVRFNRAFRFFRIDRVREEMKRLNRETALPDSTDVGIKDGAIDEDVLRGLADLHRINSSPEEHTYRQQVRRAIMALPANERRAVVLCYLLGFKEESEDPSERTAATICGVTGRTIRNWLKNACTKLLTLKEAA